MMNDIMDMVHVGCEEMITAADEAQMEHERGEREAEARERAEAWAQLEAVHGTLLTRSEWAQHEHDYSEYVDMVWKD